MSWDCEGARTVSSGFMPEGLTSATDPVVHAPISHDDTPAASRGATEEASVEAHDSQPVHSILASRRGLAEATVEGLHIQTLECLSRAQTGMSAGQPSAQPPQQPSLFVPAPSQAKLALSQGSFSGVQVSSMPSQIHVDVDLKSSLKSKWRQEAAIDVTIVSAAHLPKMDLFGKVLFVACRQHLRSVYVNHLSDEALLCRLMRTLSVRWRDRRTRHGLSKTAFCRSGRNQ